jgi:PAS domain-containing protein
MEIKFKSQASIALEQATVYLQRARRIFTRLRSGAADKLQDARRAPANDLGKLLANSLDAIVVTNDDQCLVDANPKALDLFGVSELNMRKFTIDTFLSHCQILEVRRKWFAIRRDERYGKCTIRRLDGSLRVADYLFVAKIIPRNHLYRFLNVTTRRITQLRSSAKMPISSTGDSQKAIDVLLQP